MCVYLTFSIAHANMAMQVGHVNEHNKSKEDFDSFLKHLEHWMLSNVINDKKPCTFLPVIGTNTYNLLTKLLVSAIVASTMQGSNLK